MKSTILFATSMVVLLFALSSCQAPSRTLELSVPLSQPGVEPADPNMVADPLDALVAIETIAAKNGLKPQSQAGGDDDILGLADIDTPESNVQNWRHPDYPVYLTATRHKGEILLLLNYVDEAAGNPAATKIFNAIRNQLTTELPQTLKIRFAGTK